MRIKNYRKVCMSAKSMIKGYSGAQITGGVTPQNFKYCLKFSRRRLLLDPHKAQLSISQRPHHHKHTELRSRSKNRGIDFGPCTYLLYLMNVLASLFLCDLKFKKVKSAESDDFPYDLICTNWPIY